MNNYDWFQPRKRNRNLLIVEGNHEKNELISLILKIYPQIDIEMNDIVIYHTNIYDLYNEIVLAYGDEWINQDIDLPLIVGKKLKIHEDMSRVNFKNIFIVFDYERHDPYFLDEKIENLQLYFKDPTDEGKLYINYPMVESYQHLISLPDASYAERSISVSMQPGSHYKNKVKQESYLASKMAFPNKIKEILFERFDVLEQNKSIALMEQILMINSVEEDLSIQINEILKYSIEEKKLPTAIYQMKHLIIHCGYANEEKNYYEYMRSIFNQVIIHNICKANRIQRNEFSVFKKNLRSCFETLDFNRILNLQNIRSRDEKAGMIWVLNTFALFVPEYKFSLIE